MDERDAVAGVVGADRRSTRERVERDRECGERARRQDGQGRERDRGD
jgi:hypothetical protein